MILPCFSVECLLTYICCSFLSHTINNMLKDSIIDFLYKNFWNLAINIKLSDTVLTSAGLAHMSWKNWE